MADPESTSPLDSSKKENLAPTQAKIAELNESRTELLGRIQSLKQDLHKWRSNLDTQVQTYRSELVGLRKSLIVEVNQLRSEFSELRTTLQQQQEDVAASLQSLGLQDLPQDPVTSTSTNRYDKIDDEGNKHQAEANEHGSSNGKTNAEESISEGNGIEVHLSPTDDIDSIESNH
ncbi:uncharacterized protein LOC130817528 [Amaranthus tricolor]|uniref:uncharacterized protein LOC130817528 n=1 Tax=Amaranthus tricolor TaxID=29722 RepID=UPI0025880178|nr:uncharacterized protein LOC130817528 [Amaranthus tricolor]